MTNAPLSGANLRGVIDDVHDWPVAVASTTWRPAVDFNLVEAKSFNVKGRHTSRCCLELY